MKKVLGGLALAVGAAGIPGMLVALALGISLLAGLIVTTSGGLGAMFADKTIRQQYGLLDQCGVDSGGGGAVPITATQNEYVRTVIGIGKTMGVPERGWIVAVAAIAQESGFKNYANDGANHRGYDGFPAPGSKYWLDTAKLSMNYPHDAVGHDADSVGLLQQRPSTGWGDGDGITARQNPEAAVQRLLDPRWAVQAFFGGPGGPANRGLTDIDNWESLPITVAAQRVQGSAFPNAYAKWEAQATALVRANADAPAIALLSGAPGGGSGGGGNASSQIAHPLAGQTFSESSKYGMRKHPVYGDYRMHTGLDFSASIGTPIAAAADGVVVKAGYVGHGFGNWVVLRHEISGQRYDTVYGHISAWDVAEGQTVTKGQRIAAVGNEGTSTGAHLHFEVWQGGYSGGTHIDPEPWLGGATSGGSAECVGADGSVSSGNGTVDAVIKAGMNVMGTPYSWGGGTLTGPSNGFASGAGTVGFDCSSLTRFMFYQGTGGSVTLPRTSREQYAATAGNRVEWKDMQPGDLIFYGSSPATIHHVAVYIGDGKILHAPKPGRTVEVVTAYKSGYLASTRVSLTAGA